MGYKLGIKHWNGFKQLRNYKKHNINMKVLVILSSVQSNESLPGWS